MSLLPCPPEAPCTGTDRSAAGWLNRLRETRVPNNNGSLDFLHSPDTALVGEKRIGPDGAEEPDFVHTPQAPAPQGDESRENDLPGQLRGNGAAEVGPLPLPYVIRDPRPQPPK